MAFDSNKFLAQRQAMRQQYAAEEQQAAPEQQAPPKVEGGLKSRRVPGQRRSIEPTGVDPVQEMNDLVARNPEYGEKWNTVQQLLASSNADTRDRGVDRMMALKRDMTQSALGSLWGGVTGMAGSLVEADGMANKAYATAVKGTTDIIAEGAESLGWEGVAEGVRNTGKILYTPSVIRAKISDKYADKVMDYSQKFAPQQNYRYGITESFQKGRWAEGFDQLFHTGLQNAPQLAASMTGWGIPVVASSAIGMKYNELQKDKSLTESERWINAVGVGLVEAAAEKGGMLIPGGTALKPHAVDSLKKAAGFILKRTAGQMGEEGMEEVFAQAGENAIDIAMGIERDGEKVTPFMGLSDAGIVGAFIGAPGGMIHGAGQVGLRNRRDRLEGMVDAVTPDTPPDVPTDMLTGKPLEGNTFNDAVSANTGPGTFNDVMAAKTGPGTFQDEMERKDQAMSAKTFNELMAERENTDYHPGQEALTTLEQGDSLYARSPLQIGYDYPITPQDQPPLLEHDGSVKSGMDPRPLQIGMEERKPRTGGVQETDQVIEQGQDERLQLEHDGSIKTGMSPRPLQLGMEERKSRAGGVQETDRVIEQGQDERPPLEHDGTIKSGYEPRPPKFNRIEAGPGVDGGLHAFTRRGVPFENQPTAEATEQRTEGLKKTKGKSKKDLAQNVEDVAKPDNDKKGPPPGGAGVAVKKEAAQGSLEKISDLGYRNPLNEQETIIHGTGVTLANSQLTEEPTIHISDIRAVDGQGKGNGTKAMEEIIKIADKDGVNLSATPTATGNTSEEQLKKWYSKLGFVEGAQGVWTRPPNTTTGTKPGKVLDLSGSGGMVEINTKDGTTTRPPKNTKPQQGLDPRDKDVVSQAASRIDKEVEDLQRTGNPRRLRAEIANSMDGESPQIKRAIADHVAKVNPEAANHMRMEGPLELREYFSAPKKQKAKKTPKRDTPQQEAWETSDLATTPNIPDNKVQAKKQPDGSWKLMHKGTQNEVFAGKRFKSAHEARSFFKAQKLKAQAYGRSKGKASNTPKQEAEETDLKEKPAPGEGKEKPKSTRYEEGKKLTPEQRNKALSEIGDAYRDYKLEKVLKGYTHDGEEIYGYPYAPEAMRTSDITGRLVRYYIFLPDGRIAHPTELFPDVTEAKVKSLIKEQEIAAENERRARESDERSWRSRIVKTGDLSEVNRIFWRHLPGNWKGAHHVMVNKDGHQVRVRDEAKKQIEFYKSQGFKRDIELDARVQEAAAERAAKEKPKVKKATKEKPAPAAKKAKLKTEKLDTTNPALQEFRREVKERGGLKLAEGLTWDDHDGQVAPIYRGKKGQGATWDQFVESAESHGLVSNDATPDQIASLLRGPAKQTVEVPIEETDSDSGFSVSYDSLSLEAQEVVDALDPKNKSVDAAKEKLRRQIETREKELEGLSEEESSGPRKALKNSKNLLNELEGGGQAQEFMFPFEQEEADAQYDDDDFLFSKSEGGTIDGMTIAEVEDAVAGLSSRWADTENYLHIVQSQDQLPEAIQRKAGNSKIHGVAQGNDVWLVADNLRDVEHAASTIIHEVVGHKGIRAALKAFGVKPDAFFSRLALSRFEEISAFAKERGFDFKDKNERMEAAEEWLAEHIEGRNYKSLGSMWSKLKAMFRDAYRRILGKNLPFEVTDSMVESLISAARKQVESGGKGGGDTRFSRKKGDIKDLNPADLAIKSKGTFEYNATGDVVVGDHVLFERDKWGGSYRKPVHLGTEEVKAVVIRDSYGAEKQQHTFTLETYDGEQTRIKGRNLYRNGVMRKAWRNEEAREDAATEKHNRGDAARSVRDRRREEEQGGSTVRFSRSGDGSDMVVMHNLSEDNLSFVDEMDGSLAMPSVAIAKVEHPLRNFGDVSLFAQPDLIDPRKSRKNKVFPGDAYSPRYPKVVYSPKKEMKSKLEDISQWISDEYGGAQDGQHRHLRSATHGYYSFSESLSFDPREDTEYFGNNRAVMAYYMGKVLGNKVPKTEVPYGTSKPPWFTAPKREYDKWVKQFTDGLVDKKLFKGFTPAGYRKYVPYSTENVLKEMRRMYREEGGESFFYGAGSVRARAMSPFKSMAEIKRSRDKLVGDMGELKDEFDSRVSEISGGIRAETFWAAVIESNMGRNKKVLDEYGLDYDQIPWDDVRGLVEDLTEAPTQYFEAKPDRIVHLSEFDGAVLPRTASDKTKDILYKHGVTNIEFYDDAAGVGRTTFEQAVEKVTEYDNDLRFSRTRDADYMDAVNRGDMETAQKMVDEAAREAGYNTTASHGVKAYGPGWQGDYNKFDPSLGEYGVHLGTPEIARGMAKGFMDIPDGRVIDAYVRFDNPLRMEDPGNWSTERFVDQLIDNGDMTEADAVAFEEEQTRLWQEGGFDRNRDVKALLAKYGYDGVVYLNRREGFLPEDLKNNTSKLDDLSDSEFKAQVPNATDSYIAFYPNQIKQSDPVTYDDDGNVIPLSQRFTESDDIRFSKSKSVDQTQTKQFKNWFKDSKVVDKNGKPEVMFHATASPFTVFDTQGFGSHFGTTQAANDRAMDMSKSREGFTLGLRSQWRDRLTKGSNLKPVYLSVQNPLRMKDIGAFHDAYSLAEGLLGADSNELDKDALAEISSEALELRNSFDDELAFDENDNVIPFQSAWSMSQENQELLDELKSLVEMADYDGVVYANEAEGLGDDSWIVFNPEQVKSATGNTGAFDPDNLDIRYSLSPRDADYMDAVNRGDMDTAQQMVDQAAKEAGYNVRAVEHGSYNPNIKEFRPGRSGGIYFTDDPEYSRGYGPNIYQAYLKSEKPADIRLNGAEHKMAVDYFNSNGGWSMNDEAMEERKTPDFDPRLDKTWELYDNLDVDVSEWLQSQGYDMVITEEPTGSTAYVVFSPNQIKSADPVTYDDNGNVIPLSQRFTESDDIRYSKKDMATMEVYDPEYANPEAVIDAFKDGKLLVHARVKDGTDLSGGIDPSAGTFLRSTESWQTAKEYYGDGPELTFFSDNTEPMGSWAKTIANFHDAPDAPVQLVFVEKSEDIQKSLGEGRVELSDGREVSYEMSPLADFEDPVYKGEPGGVESGDWYTNKVADVVAVMDYTDDIRFSKSNPFLMEDNAFSDKVKRAHKKVNVDTIGKYLAKQLPKVDISSPQGYRRLKGMARKELRLTLEQPLTGGAFWYESDPVATRVLLEHLFPGFTTDDWVLFNTIAAPMSAGNTPNAESYAGIRAYEIYRKDGVVPKTQPNGKGWTGYGVKKQMATVQELIDRFGKNGLLDFLAKEYSARELRDLGYTPGETPLTVEDGDTRIENWVTGARVLGPKVSSYFMNIVGIAHDGSTVDLWDNRAWKRRAGDTGFDYKKSPIIKTERTIFQRIHRELGSEFGLESQQVQAALWHFEKDLYRVHGKNVPPEGRVSGIIKYATQHRGMSSEEIDALIGPIENEIHDRETAIRNARLNGKTNARREVPYDIQRSINQGKRESRVPITGQVDRYEQVLGKGGDFRRDREPIRFSKTSEARDFAKKEFEQAQDGVLDWYRSYTANLDKNAKKDLHPVLDVLLRAPSHTYRKIPAMKKIFEAGNLLRDDKHFFENQIFNDETGASELGLLQEFKRLIPDQYEKMNKYLFDKDREAVGYTVRKNGEQYTLVSPEGRSLTTFDNEEDAWQSAYLYEQQDLLRAGYSKEFAAAVLAVRRINHRDYGQLMQNISTLEEEYQNAGKDAPITDWDGEDMSIFEALRRMGDRRGHYMPRIRKGARYLLYAEKAGESPILETFDMKGTRRLRAKQLAHQGYNVTEMLSEQPSEDAHLDNNLIAMNDLLQKAMGRVAARGEQNGTYESFGLEAEWIDYKTVDGKTERHFIVAGPNRKKYREIFMDFGGQRYEKQRDDDQDVWHFKEPSEKFEGELLNAISHVEFGENTALGVFGHALLGEVANIIHARGSRARKIGRSDKTGEDVVRGYFEDTLKAVTLAGKATAGGTAKRKMGRTMMRAIMGTDVTWRDFKRDNAPKTPITDEQEKRRYNQALWEKYMKLVDANRIDSALQPVAYGEALSYMKEMMRNDTSAERVMGVIKGLASVKYLSGLGPGLVNLTALATTVPASMHTFGGIPFRDAPGLLTGAMKDYHQYYMHMKFGKGKAHEGEKGWLFDEIRSRGWDEAQYNMEAISALQSEAGRTGRLAMDYAMLPFAITERMNRGATIAAAYYGIKKNHKGKWDRAAQEDALVKAKKVSDMGHGVYGKANLPKWARGDNVGSQTLRALYMFKTFTHNYLQVLAHMGFKDKKAAVYMLASPMIIGGVGASLATSVVSAALKALGLGDDPEEEFYQWAESTFGQTGGRLARYGIVGAGAGVTIRGSLSPTMQMPKTAMDWFGAPGSAIRDVADAGRLTMSGDVYKGIETLMPRVLQGPMKGYREYSEGITTQSNLPVIYEDEVLKASPAAAWIRAAGFNPVGIAEPRERMWAEKKRQNKYKELRSGIYTRVRRWYLEGKDTAEWIDLQSMIGDYNARVDRMGYEDVAKITDGSVKRVMSGLQK